MFFDIIIIGGGPAGSTAATFLARKGYQVLVLEKEKFPREHVGESLLPFCYPLFQELGVLEQMELNFSRKPGVVFSNVDGSSASNWCFDKVIKDESALSFHVRRATFDDILLRNSEKSGALVSEQVTVKSVDLSAADQVVVTAEKDDVTQQFNARFLVDASGQSTFLARHLKSKKPFTSMQPRVAYSTHWKDANLTTDLNAGNIKIVHLEGEKIGWCWMIPLKDNRLSIGVALSSEYANQQRRLLQEKSDNWALELYLQELQSSPIIREVIEGACRWDETHVEINGDYSYYSSEKWGSNYAIIGDAAGFLDPIFSSGIYLGMKSGLLVADGIDELFSTHNEQKITKAYEDIGGAYRLVEKLINIFYEPGSIKLNQADLAFDLSFEKFEAAYSILHLILAGDFFTNYEKYMKAIEMLRNPGNIEKYKHLIKHDSAGEQNKVCTSSI